MNDLRRSSFSVISFCLFILFMGFSRQECWSGLPYPSPMDHVLNQRASWWKWKRRMKWQTTSVFLPWEPHDQYEKANRYDTERWTPQVSRGPICYWRRVQSNSRKNEETEPKQKQHPVAHVTGDGSKVQCCKEQYCIGTWNVRSMNHGKLWVVKQKMARVNTDILGISEPKWTGMGEFNSDDHYIYYCGQESLRRNGVAIMVNKRVWSAVLGCNLKNDRMISSFPRQTIQYHSNPSLCPCK